MDASFSTRAEFHVLLKPVIYFTENSISFLKSKQIKTVNYINARKSLLSLNLYLLETLLIKQIPKHQK